MATNITDWSKAKLNKGIAELVYPDYNLIRTGGHGAVVYLSPNSAPLRVDYLNNWNDLIPLMIKYDVLYQLSKLAKPREMAECLYMVLLAKSKEG